MVARYSYNLDIIFVVHEIIDNTAIPLKKSMLLSLLFSTIKPPYFNYTIKKETIIVSIYQI